MRKNIHTWVVATVKKKGIQEESHKVEGRKVPGGVTGSAEILHDPLMNQSA